MNKFTKADLKPNMIVELRDANMYLIHEFHNELVLVKEDEWLDLLDYTEDLSFYDKVFRRFDIVAVREPAEVYQLKASSWQEAPIIWERKELSKLTEDEKVILRNALIDGEKPLWITRDEYGGNLAVAAGKIKPTKEDVFWHSRYESRNLTLFKHLFQFVKWEDDEPWYIPDLLGESEG